MKAGGKHIVRRGPAPIPPGFPPDLNPVLARVLASRRVVRAEELELRLEALLPYHALSGIDAAVELLAEGLERRWRILVVGDFDADGATSTAVAVRGLRAMGAAEVDFLVPNRFEFGYGLTPEIVAVAAERRPDLIVTVDNGISSVGGVAAANAAGIRVLVTDHHLPGEQLPEAAAMVNPNQHGDAFASKGLAGVGVIFYVLLALRGHLRELGWFTARGLELPNLARYLDLVALGTVADVVPLDHNNRILVAQGLARIRAGQACPGILALIAVAKRDHRRIVASDLGYAIGPRLNAAGRMDDMSRGIRCLLTDDPHEAQAMAAELDRLNLERRSTEEGMREEALADLKRMDLDEEAMPFGLCLYNPDWHPGVVGILASRIKERVHRPVIVFTDWGEDEIKGSARSVNGVHIRDALDAVAAAHPGLLVKFGGHAMAAGLTLKRTDLETFRAVFDAEVRRHLAEEDLHGVVHSDGGLGPDEADLELAELLRMAMPWGQGFAEPVFDDEFEVVQRRVVGERHLKLALRWPGEGRTVDAIAFYADFEALPEGMRRARVAYRLDVNEWQGRRSLQLVVEHIEATG